MFFLCEKTLSSRSPVLRVSVTLKDSNYRRRLNARERFDTDTTCQCLQCDPTRQTKKTAQDAARAVRILADTASRLFVDSLTSYKRKDDLIMLAGVLQIPTTGTVADLTARINAHLEAHLELEQNPRFTGLFRNWRGNDGNSVDNTTNVTNT